MLSSGLYAQKIPKEHSEKQVQMNRQPVITFTVIDAPKHTFGYSIFTNGKLLIRQLSIPALPGETGFSTKQKASAVAKLVIKKIKNGEMPPTITEAEMKKIGAIQ
jgi:hypothetical protein